MLDDRGLKKLPHAVMNMMHCFCLVVNTEYGGPEGRRSGASGSRESGSPVLWKGMVLWEESI